VAAKEVRLFGLAPHLLDRWREQFWETRNDYRRRLFLISLQQRGMNVASAVVQIAALVWLAARLPAHVSPGDVTIIVQALISVPGLMFVLGHSLRQFGEVSGFGRDVRTLLAMPTANHLTAAPAAGTLAPAVDAPSRDVPGAEAVAIVARDVSFSYPGAATPTLCGVDLTVAAGECVAIIGENGAGKSTLLKVLLGLYAADRGEVVMGEMPVRAMPPDQRRRTIAAVFQRPVRYPASMQENITLGHQPEPVGDEELARIVAISGVGEVIPVLADGLGTVLTPDIGGVDLSGGQWQRVAIARAMWRDARVLALDEPTSALDPLAEVDLFRRFAELAAGRTTLLVSHRLGMARLADRIVVVADGRIAETGTHDALLARDGHYAAMWAAQARWYA
jgi:ATP-binding cassette subfamily B protein